MKDSEARTQLDNTPSFINFGTELPWGTGIPDLTVVSPTSKLNASLFDLSCQISGDYIFWNDAVRAVMQDNRRSIKAGIVGMYMDAFTGLPKADDPSQYLRGLCRVLYFAPNTSNTQSEEPPRDIALNTRRSALKSRFEELARLEQNWDLDGAVEISSEVVNAASNIAEASLDVDAEPYIGPAADGSILLEWEFAEGTSVDIFVESSEFPSTAALTINDRVHRVRLNGPEGLKALLRGASEMMSSSSTARVNPT